MIKIVKITFTILIIATFSISNSFAQIQFFTMKEGLQDAINAAGISNPLLVNAFTSNAIEITLPMGLGSFTGEIIYEGENIGKANVWGYTFVSANNPDVISQIGAIKISFFGIVTDPIDLSQLIDSDEFVKKLIENQLHADMQNACVGDNCLSVVGVGAITSEYLCMQAEEISWIRIVENFTGQRFCCKTPFNDASLLSCEDYSSISEIANEISISIFPNPATNTVTINNPDGFNVSAITIYDLQGNRVAEFSPFSSELDISNLLSGNYYICFTVGNRKIYRSVVVKR